MEQVIARSGSAADVVLVALLLNGSAQAVVGGNDRRFGMDGAGHEGHADSKNPDRRLPVTTHGFSSLDRWGWICP